MTGDRCGQTHSADTATNAQMFWFDASAKTNGRIVARFDLRSPLGGEALPSIGLLRSIE